MKVIRTTEPAILAMRLVNEQLASNFERPILLLLSGGSWLSLYDQIDAEQLGPWLTIGVLDERFSGDPAVNNFAQLMQTQLYKSAEAKKASFIDTRIKRGESFAELSDRFNQVLKVWREQNPDGVVVATLGLGPDGHTAGIFSVFAEESDQSANCAVGYQVDESVNEFTKRITVTPHFLTSEVQSAVSFVSGDNKCARLKQIIVNDKTKEAIPAQIWNEMKNVEVVTNCLE